MGARAPPGRSHTEAFLFMRTSGLQRRRFATEQEEGEQYGDDARVSLLRGEEGEGGLVPDWAGRVEGLNYQITRVEGKVAELATLHTKHLSRPGLEEGDEEERTIQSRGAQIQKWPCDKGFSTKSGPDMKN